MFASIIVGRQDAHRYRYAMNAGNGRMPGWNLALRFLLEIAAWSGFAWGGWRLGSWPLGIALLIATVVAWGTFAVPGDPSRSGKAPVAVPGVVRFALEVVILFGGCVMFWVGGAPVIALVLAGLNVVHLVVGLDRVRWLLRR
jgi:hypothetical protein